MIDAATNVVAANPNCFFGFSPFVAYRQFPKAGIHYVEVPSGSSGTDGFVPELMSEGDVQELKDRLTELELTPVSVGAYCDLLKDNHVDLLLRRIEFARQLGAGCVVTDATLQLEVDANDWRRLVNALRYAGDCAQDRGISIALETHGGLTRSGAHCQKLLDAVDHPSVGVNYDTGNIYYYNDDINPAEDVKHVLGRVFQVHLKDTVGGKGEWEFCALGEGRVNFPAVVEALQASGFRGPYSLELEGRQSEDLNRAGNLKIVQSSMDYLRRIGLAT